LLGEGRRRRRREPRLIVNLSLGIDLPIPVRLLERWFPRTARDPVALKEHQPDIDRALRSLEASLQAAIDWLFERGVLVVAASGNDALRPDVTPNDPPPPRFPARYENVLGVAAMRRNEHLAADYSNRGDLTTGAWPGHVATFGGNVIRPSNAQSSALTERDDSIVGIFSSRSLPGSGDANTSGWVRWAGTSFSAPIATAVAARLWAIDPELAPLEVMAAVRGFARDPHGGPDPESPLEVPVLEASQG
jgi:subtilisin family serine protease